MDESDDRQELWTAVDEYLDALVRPDDVLSGTVVASEKAGLPPINVAPNQGKLLMILALAIRARAILELGTLGGYSTIWLARALPPDGCLITVESEPAHAAVARTNLARAGLANVVDVRVGSALDVLPTLEDRTFDLIFIDADKDKYAEYFAGAVRLSHPGTVIIADNVVREGAVIDAANADPRVKGVRKFIDVVAGEPRVTATAIQTVGSKGHDGFVIAVVSS